MRIFGYNVTRAEIKSSVALKSSGPTDPGGDVVERPGINDGYMKAYIPSFLYKPPYGYPRPENIPLLRTLGRNPYVFSVINVLQEEAAGNKWEIVPKDKDVEMTPALEETKKKIIDFLNNPNGNKESFADLVKAAVRDIAEVDAGVWVKVFNRQREMVQLFARDGGYFLKNPDLYGYLGNREDIVYINGEDAGLFQSNESVQLEKTFNLQFKENAAYFQYGFTNSRFPVPFGKREIIYMMKNPRSDSCYGISPIQVLADIIQTLVYGSMYNLDFYMNSNMPEGIIELLGADAQTLKSFRDRLNNEIREEDPVTGFMRKIGFKMPIVNVASKFTPFQLGAREMQIFEQQTWFTKVVWMCFGVTADDMGFTENSNKAVSQTMEKRFARKAVRPILRLIEERINMELIPEFGTTDLMFKYEDYDLDEDIKRHTLYEAQIRMGIKTAEMVAEEEHIDLDKLKKTKEEATAMQQQEMGNEDGSTKDDGVESDKKDTKKAETKAKTKDSFEDTTLEKVLISQIKDKSKAVLEAIEDRKKKVENVTAQ